MAFVAAVQLLCATVLAVDVGAELHEELRQYAASSIGMILQLFFETLATLALFVGFDLTRRQIARLRRAAVGDTATLRNLRGDFDSLLHQRFADWGLSRAETDIALLSLRGLKITEIARMRNTRDGTIRAQLCTIFRKSGMNSRTELLAYFMDEFLQYGAQTRDSRGASPTLMKRVTGDWAQRLILRQDDMVKLLIYNT